MEDSRLIIEPIPAALTPPQAPAKGESYWDLVLRQFRRNRMAVVSFFFVLVISLIAIAAPFLANNIPIVLRGAYRGLYNERFEEWKMGGHPELVQILKSWPANGGAEAAAQLRTRLDTIDRELG